MFFRRLLSENIGDEHDNEDDLDSTTAAGVRRLQHEQLNDAEISNIMEETFEARSAWIRNSMPPVRTIFVKCPPLKDVLPSHFQKEFERVQPGVSDFFDSWEQVAPLIVSYAQRKVDNPDIASLLEEMCSGGQGQSAEIGYKPPEYLIQEYAVHLLSHIVRPPVRKGRSRLSGKEVAECFVHVVPVGSPAETVAETAGAPLLLATGPRGNLEQTFVVLEGQTTAVPSLLAGLDRAFKVHYLFNIAYNPKAEHIWQYLQKVVYNIQDNSTTFSSVYDFQAFMTKEKRRRTEN